MSTTTRRVVAWVSGMTLDGYTGGPDGPAHDQWLYEHAFQEQTSEHFEGVWRAADTIVLGRTNYEGFHAVWPGITRDPATSARHRALGQWLEDTEKVVASTTLTEAPWAHSRITRDPCAEVAALRETDGGDVIVLNSASVIQTLLRADLVDDLRVTLVPAMVGGGVRLLPDGLPAGRWSLAGTVVMGHGAVALHHRRDRAA